jgi:O-antigen/teichoic acid export membrane protein
MAQMLKKIRDRVGDLWWYSAMLFLACRTGDVIQTFIGLWLVPKYVGPGELGAIIPIQHLSAFFTIPLAALGIAFAKYVNVYATHGEYGKVKSFIKDIIIVSAFIFLICIAFAYFLLPHFYNRLNITSGALTILILSSGFINNISSLFSSATQGLKKFKLITLVNLIAAPIRLVTLIVFMPLRALSGYVLGQISPAAASGVISALILRRELKTAKTDTAWRRDIPRILKYLTPLAIYLALTSLFGTILTTVYRQRLPELESAAYYLLSRFAEIASYAGASMAVVLFPLAAEAHENGKENIKMLNHTITATAIITFLIAVFFYFCGHTIFSSIETWSIYLEYTHLLPWITFNCGAGAIISAVISYEMACRRFSVAFLIVGINAVVILLIISFTGYEFYRGLLSDGIVDWMASNNLSSLSKMTWASVASALIQLAAVGAMIYMKQKKRSKDFIHQGISQPTP